MKNLRVLQEIVILCFEIISNNETSMKIIDTKGLTCPRPLIMLKEGLLEVETGDQVQVITDNETSLKNLLSYLNDQGAIPEVETSGTVHTITTLRPGSAIAESDPAAYCTTGIVNGDYVVCLKSNLMGEGDPDLGKLLMETFLENLQAAGSSSHTRGHVQFGCETGHERVAGLQFTLRSGGAGLQNHALRYLY